MPETLLTMRDIVKTFPGVRALDGVTFDVNAGEVHALVGENGAGKSTLMKILAGAQPADSGTIAVDGTTVAIDSPKTAERLGIGMIYQEFNLVPDLGVIENIVLGVEPRHGLFLDRPAAAAEAAKVLAELGIAFDLSQLAAGPIVKTCAPFRPRISRTVAMMCSSPVSRSARRPRGRPPAAERNRST